MVESMGEYVDVIDEDENVIKTVPKGIARANVDLRRGVDVFVFNSEGRLLIHKRAVIKEVSPDTWDWRVGGWVLSGEPPEEAAKREAEEEIGARNIKLKFLFKYRYKHGNEYNDISYVYKTVYDGPINIQKEEVSEYEWIDIKNLMELIKKRKFTPNVEFVYENYKDKIFSK